MTPEEKRRRWPRPVERAQRADDTEVAATTRVDRGRVAARAASASRRSPSTSPPPSPPRGLTVGVLDADIWGFSVPRMLGIERPPRGRRGDATARGVDAARTSVEVGDGLLKVVSMGFLVEDEEHRADVAGPDAQPRRSSSSSQDVRGATTSTTSSSTCRPGTGDVQMGLAKLLPRAEMLVVTTPARAAQKVASRAAVMARKSYLRVVGRDREHELVHLRRTASTYALFGEGGGADAGRRRRRAAARPGPARAGGVARAATPASPVRCSVTARPADGLPRHRRASSSHRGDPARTAMAGCIRPACSTAARRAHRRRWTPRPRLGPVGAAHGSWSYAADQADRRRRRPWPCRLAELAEVGPAPCHPAIGEELGREVSSP